MKLAGLWLLALSLCSAASAQTALIPGLFNTGVDSSGIPLAGGAIDPHYSLIVSADAQYGPDAIVHVDPVIGGWNANTTTSKWIGPAANQNLGTYEIGEYIYRLSFDLSGFDPATASISGQWAADNGGTIFLNSTNTMQMAIAAFFSFTPFAIASGFVPGVNNLDFHVQNASGPQPNPTGLHVNQLSGLAVTLIPEPETYALLLAGLGLLGFTAQRRRLRS